MFAGCSGAKESWQPWMECVCVCVCVGGEWKLLQNICQWSTHYREGQYVDTDSHNGLTFAVYCTGTAGTHIKLLWSLQAVSPICGWMMVIPWCVTLSGCRGRLHRYSNHFLYGDIGLFRSLINDCINHIREIDTWEHGYYGFVSNVCPVSNKRFNYTQEIQESI